nr:uncharacterized protein LOC123772641 [Procambarus clarkii]
MNDGREALAYKSRTSHVQYTGIYSALATVRRTPGNTSLPHITRTVYWDILRLGNSAAYSWQHFTASHHTYSILGYTPPWQQCGVLLATLHCLTSHVQYTGIYSALATVRRTPGNTSLPHITRTVYWDILRLGNSAAYSWQHFTASHHTYSILGYTPPWQQCGVLLATLHCLTSHVQYTGIYSALATVRRTPGNTSLPHITRTVYWDILRLGNSAAYSWQHFTASHHTYSILGYTPPWQQCGVLLATLHCLTSHVQYTGIYSALATVRRTPGNTSLPHITRTVYWDILRLGNSAAYSWQHFTASHHTYSILGYTPPWQQCGVLLATLHCLTSHVQYTGIYSALATVRRTPGNTSLPHITRTVYWDILCLGNSAAYSWQHFTASHHTYSILGYTPPWQQCGHTYSILGYTPPWQQCGVLLATLHCLTSHVQYTGIYSALATVRRTPGNTSLPHITRTVYWDILRLGNSAAYSWQRLHCLQTTVLKFL